MIFLAELAFKSDRLLGWEGDYTSAAEFELPTWFLIH